MGGSVKVNDKYRSNSEGVGDDVQGGGLDGATLREKYLGSDRGDAEFYVGVPPLGGPEDSRYAISESRGGGMGAVIGGGDLGGGGSVAYEGVNLEATGYHCKVYCDSPYLLTVQRGGSDDGVNCIHVAVGPGP